MRPVICFCLLLLTPISALAQDDLRPDVGSLTPGLKVVVVDDQGHKIKGHVISATDERLTIKVLARRREQVDLGFERIESIERQDDSVWNGALIGFVSGAGIGCLSVCDDFGEAPPKQDFCGMRVWEDCEPNPGTSMLALGGVGAVVGMWIDALRHKDRHIYRRARGTRTVGLQPVVGRHSQGAVLRLAW